MTADQVIVSMLAVNVVLLLLLLKRKTSGDPSSLGLRLDSLDKGQDKNERLLRDEHRGMREDLTTRLQGFNDSVLKRMTENAGLQNTRLDSLTKASELKLENLQNKVDQKLTQIQEDNSRKLDEMRKTVDEKLQGTLDKRLTESFKLVGERLEQVHKGLGEMQTLASGVGDLKKVLTNVKVRGTWGEIQLGSLLEQILTPDQYDKNVKTRPRSDNMVEFAIKLPGRDDEDGKSVWLPIDSKYPHEDYERLIDASERGDVQAIAEAGKKIEQRIKQEARDISEKYINPPSTTDFAILFLPVEGLYGEVLRRPGLVEELQRKYRVNISGPTTLAALLNSLQMGFRTLAIQKRSSEVWKVLASVKAEFETFSGVIEKVQKKLQEASSVINDKVAVRTRMISQKLQKVQELPAPDSKKLIEPPEDQ